MVRALLNVYILRFWIVPFYVDFTCKLILILKTNWDFLCIILHISPFFDSCKDYFPRLYDFRLVTCEHDLVWLSAIKAAVI